VQELGGSIARARDIAQADELKYSIPSTSCSFCEWGLSREEESAFLVAVSSNTLLSRTLNFSWELNEICDFRVARLLLEDCFQIWSLGCKKIVLYIVYFAYSLLSLL